MKPFNIEQTNELWIIYKCYLLTNRLQIIYIYIYRDIVLFGPVKPELGVISSGQENHSGAEHLNFPGGELNVILNL